MTLHVYSQMYPHGDCFVLGTEESLKELAEAIMAACDSGKGEKNFFTSDGEGYSLHIAKLTDIELERTRLPYTSDFDEDTRKTVKSAWQYFLH